MPQEEKSTKGPLRPRSEASGSARPDSARLASGGKEINTEENEEVKQRIRIKIRAYDHKIIDQSCQTIIDTATRTGASVCGPIPLPTEKSKYTLIRSPFAHKDSREQFEMRIHKRLVDIIEPTAKTVDQLSNLSLPAGVDIEIKSM